MAAEHEFPVPPLAMPHRAKTIDLETLVRNPSMALLVDRAQALLPDLALTAGNAEAMVEICIRLDGIPLAIELAAPRLKVFSPAELLDRLQDRLAVLTGGASDVPARHRTLHAAIEWSHDLLTEPERAVFRRASVFVGGWTLSSAEQVCGGQGARDKGDLGTARVLFAEALRDFRDLDYSWAVATSAWGLGHVEVQLGETDEAASLLVESLDLYLDFDDSRGVAQCFEALAAVALARSHYRKSAQLLAAAAGLRSALAVPLPHAEAAAVRLVQDALLRLLDRRSFDRARHDGRTMPVNAAVELARGVGVMSRRPGPPLTDREHQVAALVAAGMTNRQVARNLGIAEKTAEAHVYNLMGKLGAHSRAEVASWATAEGLVAR